MAHIIAADDLKRTLPGYDPARSSDFHQVSAKMADIQYQNALKECSSKKVVLMAGGAASGKSEYVSAYLASEDLIVFDGTLPSITGAAIKIRNAKKAGKDLEVHLVTPADFTVAFVVFLNRERKFAVKHFFQTHVSSRKTILLIAEQFPEVTIRIIESDVDFVGDGGRMFFREIEFPTRNSLIDFLHQNQYTESEIRNKMYYDL